METYYVGIDVGTSGLKTILMARDGTVTASDTQDYPIHTPRPNWSEQDPKDWWTATGKGINAALSQSGIKPEQVAGIGLSGQMHGSVFLTDTSRQPLRRAILWNDQRTAQQCAYIEKVVGGRRRLISMTANPALTGFTAPKIIWVRDHEPKVYQKIRHVLLPKDYIRLCLTGEYVTDVSDASGTLLLDVRNRRWHTGLIKKLRLDPAWMPRCCESPEITGYVNASASKVTGLPAGVPVVAGAGDQAAGAVGNGIVGAGILSATLGTSGVVFAYADRAVLDPAGRVHTMCHAVPGAWCVFGCMLAAGGSFQWFRNHFGQLEMAKAQTMKVDPYDLLIDQADQAPPGTDGVFFLPYLTGERTPHADPYARGCFIGITARTDRNAMIRAVLEGITHGMKDQVEIMREIGIAVREIRASGGGARSEFWRQMQADMYDAKIVTVNVTEGSALGAAILAAVGTGAYTSVPSACRQIVKRVDVARPGRKRVELYNRHHKIFGELYQQLKCTFPKLAQLTQTEMKGKQQ